MNAALCYEHRIVKSAATRAGANEPAPNYARGTFTWDQARRRLAGLPDGGLNIAHEALDRHVDEGHGWDVALRFIGGGGARREYTYADLVVASARFASVLDSLGVKPGERVYGLLGRVPALYKAVFGTLRAGCTFCPLFAAFGPEPVRSRLEIGAASVLVTSTDLYRRKVAPIRDSLTSPIKVLLVDADPAEAEEHRALSFETSMHAADPEFPMWPTRPEDPALLHFTSGTTGKPKGALHVHEAVVAHRETGRVALDLRPGDVYWCTADPGWVTGTSYGIVAPLANRVTMIVDAGEFDAGRWYAQLQDERVSVWYTAPTAIRMLMKSGDELPRAHDLSSLRFLASVGEPLNPEAVLWSERVFGRPFHDNWWQTETGGIMIANTAAMDVLPGSMGEPLPGIHAGIVERTPDGHVRELHCPDRVGELALRTPWPSMMRDYIGERERYEKCFADGWYLTGDLARRDAEGYYWFVGRNDDLIKSAGHLIGPFEVESALMEHDAVAEAGVIGVPDETAGELVKAFVTLNPGFAPAEPLRRELLGHARRRLGPAVAPRSIEFRESLPRTRSGKILRRLLKARELGLPEGDLSTLEADAR